MTPSRRSSSCPCRARRLPAANDGRARDARSPSSWTAAFLRERAGRPPGGLRARPGRALHAALAPPVLRRPRGLPARLVHHEVQPEGLRRDRRPSHGLADVHPATPPALSQGWLELLCDLERELCEVTGMHAGDPAAGGRRRRRADRPPAHARVPRRERRVASKGHHPGLRARHEPRLGHPGRLRGRDGALRRPGSRRRGRAARRARHATWRASCSPTRTRSASSKRRSTRSPPRSTRSGGSSTTTVPT